MLLDIRTTEINMSDIGKIIKENEKRFIILIMGIDMKEIGKMIKSKGKEYSIGIQEINMKANGKIINRKEMAFSNIKMNHSMVIGIKLDGEMEKKKEKEFTILIM